MVFSSVTEENSAEFHYLMQMYSNELDEHLNQNTDAEMLKSWTNSIIQKQFDGARYLKLCYVQSTAIGFLYAKIDLPEDRGYKKIGYGYVMEFFVLPECRRKGYGKLMFQHLEDFFKSNNVKQIYLTTDPVTGKPFWEALGFAGTGEISPENDQEVYEKCVNHGTVL